MKIEIYTRSMNIDLYRLSQSTIELDFPRKRSLFTSADGYFYDNIINSKADVVINIDEDAFITDNQKLNSLIEYFLDNQFVSCGVPDGGVIPIRKHNPLVCNAFFNIFNVSEIRKKFNLKEIINNYSNHNQEFEKFAPIHLLKSIYQFDYYEPYYPFFVWLAVNFKTLYLDAEEHQDQISTVVKNQLGQNFLLHSWYSRTYGKDDYHTGRINKLIKEAKPETDIDKILRSTKSLSVIYEKLGNNYYFPLKFKCERLKWYK